MKIKHLNKVYRNRGETISRYKYLRLDKNERVTNFSNYFVKKLKNKLNSFHLSAYPEIEKIYKLLAKFLKINKEMIVITPGSDMAIRSCFELFVKPKNKVIILSPTFAMVSVYSKIFQAKTVEIKYDRKLNLQFKKLINNIDKKTSLIIIANPNSPTGTIIPKNDLLKIIKKANSNKVPILIDEAYFGFFKETYLPYVKKYRYLIISRTFSKTYGLAGVRAGYLVASQKIAKALYKLKPMYEISSFASLIVEEILKNKKIFYNYANEVEQGKKYLIKEFEKLQIEYLKTYANFIHIKLNSKKKKFENILKIKKILVRKGPGVKGFEGYLRIGLGPKPEMRKVISLLKKLKN